jgi:serine/threonine protein kinase
VTAPVVTAKSGDFVPGSVFADRFRIVGLLGKGGMGEVYRADDLELGQSVALKFLSPRLTADQVALDRFRQEVRTAREITHANVCRIHDVGEADGRVYLSMEYVDGEDLSQALKRMGRASPEKAVELARQLTLGLAAAHENGVIHGDLKPANVMVDGRGRIRIMDFGLARFAAEGGDEEKVVGTPAYMAPEQFSGTPAGIRTDLYALGLVLYEIFTGHRAFEGKSVAEYAELHAADMPTSPTSLIADMDPAVERVILRCLDKEAEDRPTSAYAILRALPGGDPLAAALSAGETPSPELIANAGERGSAPPLRALIFLIAIVLSVLGGIWLAHGRTVLPAEPPETLAVRATDVMRDLGYSDLPSHSIHSYIVGNAVQQDKEITRRNRSQQVDTNWPPAIVFWKRWQDGSLTPHTLHNALPTVDDPPLTEPGSSVVRLDTTGRLLALQHVPTTAGSNTVTGEIDWSILFGLAGLNITNFDRTASNSFAELTFSDQKFQWIGNGNENGEGVRVRGGSNRGRPVYFELFWNDLAMAREENLFDINKINGTAMLLMITFLLAHAGALLLAWRLLRQGKADRKGALRVATFIFVIFLINGVINGWITEARTIVVFLKLIGGNILGHASVHALQAFCFYIILEPYVRRFWPGIMVSWARLLSGRVRDPLVGRDLLEGMVWGSATFLLLILVERILEMSGIPAPSFVPYMSMELMGNPEIFLELPGITLANAFLSVLPAFVILLLARLIFRRTDVAIGLALFFKILMTSRGFWSPPDAGYLIYNIVLGIPWAVIGMVVLLRRGLLVTVGMTWIFAWMRHVPLTLGNPAGHAGPTEWGILVLFLVVGYAYHTSLGGQSVLAFGEEREQPRE